MLPVDVNASTGKCTVPDGAIRLGFNQIKGFGEIAIVQLIEARAAGDFRSLADFCRRTQLSQRLIENLILAGGMDTWGKTHRSLVWELGKLDYRPNTLALDLPEDTLDLPAVSTLEVMGIEYDLLGMSLRDHIMSLYRTRLKEHRVLDSYELEQCQDGDELVVAGQILVHQAPPTAKGHHFITLEDEDSFINLIVRPDVYTNYRRILREYPLIFVKGTLQRHQGVTNVIAQHIASL